MSRLNRIGSAASAGPKVTTSVTTCVTTRQSPTRPAAAMLDAILADMIPIPRIVFPASRMPADGLTSHRSTLDFP